MTASPKKFKKNGEEKRKPGPKGPRDRRQDSLNALDRTKQRLAFTMSQKLVVQMMKWIWGL
jgi:hypothetical protein